MRYADRVAPAALVLNALRSQVIGDMQERHGVAWWDGLDEPRRLLVGDYLIGLTESTSTNLTQAVMHLDRFVSLQDAIDIETMRNMRSAAARGSTFGPTSETFDNNSVEASGHFAGFFRALGSVLDNLGGIVVGSLGMPNNVVKASWGDLTGWQEKGRRAPAKHGLTIEHCTFISDVIGRIAAYLTETPTEWIEWSLDYRNSLVHRAARLTFMVLDRHARSGIAHPAPRHPAQTQAESFAMSRTVADDLVRRETVDTMTLIHNETLKLVPFIAHACIDAWQARKQNPALHFQPTAQWPELQQGRRLRFEGAGRQASLSSATSAVMHPTTADRLQVARLTDQDRAQWQRWMRGHGNA